MMDLKHRWELLCDKLSIPQAKGLYNTHIEPRYSEPHRAYHNLTHIDSCLAYFAGLGESAMRDPESGMFATVATDDEVNAVELALWFHDIVYDPKASDNEDKSAEFMTDLLESFAVNRTTLYDAADLIDLTKTHTGFGVRGRGAKVLVDIDLSVLGANPKTYWQYEHAVRREYSFVPEDIYVRERIKVLQKFAERELVDRLFLTPLFKGVLNNQARQNLTHAIAYLEGSVTWTGQTSTDPASDLPSPPAG